MSSLSNLNDYWRLHSEELAERILASYPSLHGLDDAQSPGGMACAINQMRLDELRPLVERAVLFVEQVYFPDTVAIASFYPDWWHIGASNPNLMAIGDAGALVGGDPNTAGTTASSSPAFC